MWWKRSQARGVVRQQFIRMLGVISSEPGKNREEKFNSAFPAVRFSSLASFASQPFLSNQRVRSHVMLSLKTSLLAVLLGIILAGCSSVPATPPRRVA